MSANKTYEGIVSAEIVDGADDAPVELVDAVSETARDVVASLLQRASETNSQEHPLIEALLSAEHDLDDAVRRHHMVLLLPPSTPGLADSMSAAASRMQEAHRLRQDALAAVLDAVIEAGRPGPPASAGVDEIVASARDTLNGPTLDPSKGSFTLTVCVSWERSERDDAIEANVEQAEDVEAEPADAAGSGGEAGSLGEDGDHDELDEETGSETEEAVSVAPGAVEEAIRGVDEEGGHAEETSADPSQSLSPTDDRLIQETPEVEETEDLLTQILDDLRQPAQADVRRVRREIRAFFASLPDDAALCRDYVEAFLEPNPGPTIRSSILASAALRVGAVVLDRSNAEALTTDLLCERRWVEAAAMMLAEPAIQWPLNLPPWVLVLVADFMRIPESLILIQQSLIEHARMMPSGEGQIALALMAGPLSLRYGEDLGYNPVQACLTAAREASHYEHFRSWSHDMGSYYERNQQNYPEASVRAALADDAPSNLVRELQTELQELKERLPRTAWQGVKVCERTWGDLMNEQGPVWPYLTAILEGRQSPEAVASVYEWIQAFDPNDALRRAEAEARSAGRSSKRIEGSRRRRMAGHLADLRSLAIRWVDASRRGLEISGRDLSDALQLQSTTADMWHDICDDWRQMTTDMPWLSPVVAETRRYLADILSLVHEV